MIEKFNEISKEVAGKMQSDFPAFFDPMAKQLEKLKSEKFDDIFKNNQNADLKFQEMKRENVNENQEVNGCKSDFPILLETPRTYDNLNDLRHDIPYKEIKALKPQNSPNISKWFEQGGSIRIEKQDGKEIFTYRDKEKNEVSYVNGEVRFPPEAKHPVIPDINIEKFTGDRNEDKRIYLEKLKEMYGLTEIPEGYVLHHDCENGNLQLIKEDYHKKFTHAGGHSKFKEMD